MKIVSWNCNGAFRNKFHQISKYNADIYIIQECDNPAESGHEDYITWANNFIWEGDFKSKGIGVFARSEIKLHRLDWSDCFQNHRVKHFLPCRVNNNFNLLAVWTHKNNSPNFGYIGQLWKYIQLNKPRLEGAIIAGDFNSNVIWDEWDRWWNHSDVVNELRGIGSESVYHHMRNEFQGKETTPTLYFQRKLSRPYHIDYFFAPKKYLENSKTIEIGETDKWLGLSDHMPIFWEFL